MKTTDRKAARRPTASADRPGGDVARAGAEARGFSVRRAAGADRTGPFTDGATLH